MSTPTESVIKVDVTQEVRCPQCNKLAFKGRLGRRSALEIQCKRCKDPVTDKHFCYRIRVM